MRWSELFLEYIAPPLLAVVFALAGRALAWLGGMAKARASESKLAATGARVTHFVEIVVADLNATVRPEMEKRLRDDGRLDEADGAALKAMAMERLKKLLTEHGMEELQSVLGIVGPQVEMYLSALIEKSVSLSRAPALVAGVVSAAVPSKAFEQPAPR